MIDPNIALAYRGVEVQDPLTIQLQQANLQTIANQQQIQQAHLKGLQQENTGRDLQLAQMKSMIQA